MSEVAEMQPLDLSCSGPKFWADSAVSNPSHAAFLKRKAPESTAQSERGAAWRVGPRPRGGDAFRRKSAAIELALGT